MPNAVELADGDGHKVNVGSDGTIPVTMAAGVVATMPTDPFGANADAASASGSISAKLRAIATATGITAFDLGTGTGGTRTLRTFLDTASTVGIAAGTAHIGQVKTPIQYVTVTMSAETTALDVGDIAATTQVVANATQAADVMAVLHSVTLIDVDDQKAKLNLVFFDANTSLGTEGAAPDVDDTEAQTVIGIVPIVVSDYTDLGGASVVNLRNIGLIVKPATGTRDIYMGIYSPDTSTPTYASGTIYVRLGFM